MLPPTKPFQQ